MGGSSLNLIEGEEKVIYNSIIKNNWKYADGIDELNRNTYDGLEGLEKNFVEAHQRSLKEICLMSSKEMRRMFMKSSVNMRETSLINTSCISKLSLLQLLLSMWLNVEVVRHGILLRSKRRNNKCRIKMVHIKKPNTKNYASMASLLATKQLWNTYAKS
jgi:hypothetical protein